jgi:peptidoglycan/xylan/chitin deacetylase (PgdA/CDA1 family)
MQAMNDSSMVNNPRIVVFTGDFSHSVRKGIAEIGRAIPNLSWLIVIQIPKKPPAQLFRSQWRNFKRNGWRWIPYQVVDLWQRLSATPNTPASSRAPGADLTEPVLTKSDRIKVLKVGDIHAEPSLEAVRAFKPDLGLSLAAPILRRSIFSIPHHGTLNLHKGKLPDYRGMPPAFWELWNNERSVGCTVHWVDDKLDTGNIVIETVIEREKYSTVRGLQLRLDEVGVDLMRDAVAQVLSGTARSLPQAAGGTTHRKPTLTQTSALKRRLRTDQLLAIPFTRSVVKTVAHSSALALSPLIPSRSLNPRITVLLYHRVSDEVRDNLTVGIEQFDCQMALLRKYCTALSIEEVLAFEKIPKSQTPLVCVTFDDGYLDNYSHAAQILLRHGVPAAFFVSTGIIGTEQPFPHDVRRGNPPIPTMNWTHLKKMCDWGFTVGSHSVNHIDCAAEPEEIVRMELAQSREDLRRNLGLDRVLLAYPYGGRMHMTPQRLELVKQAGYTGCLSAYGGVNIGRVDRFNVLRRGIHWEFSDRAFLLQCLGLK